MFNVQCWKVIGLTGPVAAGKNEVAKNLKRHGACVIDADQVAHTLYSHQSPVWSQLVRTFGSKILSRGGKINRKKLGEIVFSDKRKLRELNCIVHPYLKQAIIQIVTSHQSPVAGQRQETGDRKQVTVINAAVLKEIGLVDYVDEVWVVTASRENRLKRLLKMGLSRKEALKRMKLQASQKEYLEMADMVIHNDRTLRELSKVVSSLT